MDGQNELQAEQIARQREKQKVRIEIQRIDDELELERRIHEVRK